MISLVTGGFDPLHSGHITLFKAAKSISDKLIVGVNSDQWLKRKKGKYFMPIQERSTIIRNLTMVDEVITFNDDDNTAKDAIKTVLKYGDDIVFCNGGDRQETNTPELDSYKDDINFAWGVGGHNKINSSSSILKTYNQYHKVERSWGYYRVLYEGDGFKVKELVINPKSRLSRQRHKHRSETWNVVSGEAWVTLNDSHKIKLEQEKGVFIPVNTWHQGINQSNKEAHIVEIWRGNNKELNENDIERMKLIM